MLDELKLEIVKLNVRKTTLAREVDTLQDKKDDYDKCVADLDNILAQIKDMKEIENLTRQSIKILELEQAQIKIDLQIEKDNFEQEVLNKKAIKSGLNNDLKIEQDKLLAMRNDFKTESEKSTSEFKKMEKEQEKKIVELKEKQTSLKAEFENEIKTKNEALDLREGECSKKEARLELKRNDLIKLKVDLETYYNRSFPHHIIL